MPIRVVSWSSARQITPRRRFHGPWYAPRPMDDMRVELAIADLERAWAARRTELSQRLEAAVQGAIAGVLDAAGDLRRAMDQDATDLLERVRQEHTHLAGEIAAL